MIIGLVSDFLPECKSKRSFGLFIHQAGTFGAKVLSMVLKLYILKVLSHTTWGEDRTTLLQLYRSLICSKLVYGSIVYGSARKSYLAMLDPIHHQGLRLAIGAFRTSPTASLYVEADEPSLNTRREKLSLQYAIRIAENNSNPAHDVTFQPKYMDLYESKPNFIKSFGVRILF